VPELLPTRTPAPPFAPPGVDRERRRFEGLVMVGLPTLATWLCLGELYPLDQGFFTSAGVALAVSLAAALLFARRRDGPASLWAGIWASSPAWAWLFEERLRAHFFAFLWLGRRDENASGATGEHAVVAGLFAAVTIAVAMRVAPRCGVRVRRVVAGLVSIGCVAAGLLVAWGLVRHAFAPSLGTRSPPASARTPARPKGPARRRPGRSACLAARTKPSPTEARSTSPALSSGPLLRTPAPSVPWF
jgi:hypothetical protein